jgi:hypothetical protein
VAPHPLEQVDRLAHLDHTLEGVGAENYRHAFILPPSFPSSLSG